MEWSLKEILGAIGAVGGGTAIVGSVVLFIYKAGKTMNGIQAAIQELGMRVDKLEIRVDKLEERFDKRIDNLEKKVDEILFFLSHKMKKHRRKR